MMKSQATPELSPMLKWLSKKKNSSSQRVMRRFVSEIWRTRPHHTMILHFLLRILYTVPGSPVFLDSLGESLDRDNSERQVRIQQWRNKTQEHTEISPEESAPSEDTATKP